MLITLIISAHDRPDELVETLQSLSSVQIPPGCRCELIVLRWGAANVGDIPKSLSDDWPVQHLDATRLNKCAAWNLGIERSRGDIVLFADGDVRFPVSWLGAMTQPLMTGGAHAVGASVHVVSPADLSWMTQWIRDYFGETKMTAGPLEHMMGPILGIRREVFEKVPGFDVELGPGALGFLGETMFGDQIREAGFRLEAVTERVEQHAASEDLTRPGLLKRAEALGKSLAYLCHHWEHQSLSPGQLRLRTLSAALRLARWRRKHKDLTKMQDRIDPGEMELAMWYHHYGFYVSECRRPRNYTRRGLVKISQ